MKYKKIAEIHAHEIILNDNTFRFRLPYPHAKFFYHGLRRFIFDYSTTANHIENVFTIAWEITIFGLTFGNMHPLHYKM